MACWESQDQTLVWCKHNTSTVTATPSGRVRLWGTSGRNFSNNQRCSVKTEKHPVSVWSAVHVILLYKRTVSSVDSLNFEIAARLRCSCLAGRRVTPLRTQSSVGWLCSGGHSIVARKHPGRSPNRIFCVLDGEQGKIRFVPSSRSPSMGSISNDLPVLHNLVDSGPREWSYHEEGNIARPGGVSVAL